MANQQHLNHLKQGTDIWNHWKSRQDDKGIKIDLSGADLFEDRNPFIKVDPLNPNIRDPNLSDANLLQANLSGANLSGANLSGINLSGINLSGAILTRTKLISTNLNRADLSEADLSDANLQIASLVETNLKKANLTGCSIYGISAWNTRLEETTQLDLIITKEGEPIITLDNLEVAQFIYLS